MGREDLSPGPNEVLSFLSGDWRIFQRKDGHRWSLDDFMTALVAVQEGRAHDARADAREEQYVQNACDLGCGIGSVLMFVAWAFPSARCVGVEAQDVSIALARRSLVYNGADDRCELRHGDLRDASLLPEARAFDLVTGTPPYIPLGHGTTSEKTQREACCFETRGGIEDYAHAAARLLAPNGAFVACSGAFPQDRALLAGRAAGLQCTRRVTVYGKEGKPPLFVVTVMRKLDDAPHALSAPHAADSSFAPPREEVFRARTADARLPPEMHEARATLGLPPAAPDA
jgi:tRNA1(Val) A37 N6-methylase TrmN6